MYRDFRSPRLVAAFAAAALASVALPASAQTLEKTKAAPAETVDVPSGLAGLLTDSGLEIVVSEIEAVGSSLSTEEIRAILGGDFLPHVEALAGLDATRIAIPEIRVTYPGPRPGVGGGAMVYRDIELVDVVDGVAAQASIGAMTSETTEAISTSYGRMSVNDFNISALLGFYGLANVGGGGDFEVVYRDFIAEGGRLEAPGFSCELGAMTNAEFRARPLNTALMDLVELITEVEEADREPEPEEIRFLIEGFLDFLTAFDSAPSYLHSLDCEGAVEGQEIALSTGQIEVGAFVPGRYPATTLEDFRLTLTEGKSRSHVNFDSFSVKGFGYAEQLSTMLEAPLDGFEEWFEANARRFIPDFEGLSLDGLDVNISPPGGERVVFSVGVFDLSLDRYVNGIPSDIRSVADEVRIELPANSGEEAVIMARALGIETLELGYGVAMAWNEESETIEVENVSVRGRDLGAMAMAATLANATAALFSDDLDAAARAAEGLTVTGLSLDVLDSGILDIVMTIAGAEQGMTGAQMRPMLAGAAEGMLIGLLGGNEMAISVGSAIGAFIRTPGRSVSLEITPVDPAGLGLDDLMAAQSDPTALIGRVTIEVVSE